MSIFQCMKKNVYLLYAINNVDNLDSWCIKLSILLKLTQQNPTNYESIEFTRHEVILKL